MSLLIFQSTVQIGSESPQDDTCVVIALRLYVALNLSVNQKVTLSEIFCTYIVLNSKALFCPTTICLTKIAALYIL